MLLVTKNPFVKHGAHTTVMAESFEDAGDDTYGTDIEELLSLPYDHWRNEIPAGDALIRKSGGSLRCWISTIGKTAIVSLRTYDARGRLNIMTSKFKNGC